ncbi:MAG: glycosyltransferase family 4 protein [Bacteroidia bacterium]|nr:glycosyltransferase family 4 protein [Bacteroidia bacterium]
MPRILFVAAHRPRRSPSQRFRFEQYLDRLKTAGYAYDYSWLIDEADDAIFYKPGNMLNKVRIFIKSWIRRWKDSLNAGQYDLIFIHREAFMTGSVLFERMMKRSGAKLIFDFDDAIWHYDVSDANRRLGWLKRPSKTKEIIRLCDCVIAGNSYLAAYAEQYIRDVTVIPTTIDTDYHKPKLLRDWNPDSVCIGWTGSLTTVKHFRTIEPVLKRIHQKYGNRVRFKLIGDPTYTCPEIGLSGIPWNLETEVEDLSDIDIGIMPLPNDEWAKGKCGFKGLQYMAMEVPAVLSPVGVNTEIIRHHENGLLADTEQEWEDLLSFLIENPEERRRMGIAARKDIEARYSVNSQWPRYLALFNRLVS